MNDRLAEIQYKAIMAGIATNRGIRFIEVLKTNNPDEICVCNKCGWTGNGEEFTVPAGGDDYDCICPNCYAGEDHIIALHEHCEHDWVDADNEVVKGAEVCIKCKAIRAKQI